MTSFADSLMSLAPHGYCLAWRPDLMLMHVIADTLTALSYASIPVMLLIFVRRRTDLQFSWIFLLFGVFIVACGATHFMSMWTLWNPDYLAAGLVKAFTALVSVTTAIVMWPLLPKAIALPGPQQWRAINQRLQTQVEERQRAENEVREINRLLEQRVQERTSALMQANERLEAMHAVLEQRVRDRTRDLQERSEQLEVTRDELLHELAQRQQAESKLQLAASVFDNALEGIVITDETLNVLSINPSFTKIAGLRPEDAVGKNLITLYSSSDKDPSQIPLCDELLKDGHWVGELWSTRRDGSAFCVHCNLVQVPADDVRPQRFVGVFHDVTELRRKEERIHHMAFHDPLTGLPNRALVMDRLAEASRKALLREERMALLFIDLDGFKPINDSLGHAAGDDVLKTVAQRLQNRLRGVDFAARLGGDEFVVLLTQLDRPKDAENTADRLLEALAVPLVAANTTVSIGASIGIALFPDDGRSVEELLRRADDAMYAAKSLGRKRWSRAGQSSKEAPIKSGNPV
jgi:diguanylate cyclase (GGDEF)-like protein/PAS domain S-box-containing protein